MLLIYVLHKIIFTKVFWRRTITLHYISASNF